MNILFYLVWPDFSHIEWVPAIRFCVLLFHDLNRNIPRWIVSFFNSVKEILHGRIWVVTGQFRCFMRTEILDTLSGLEMELYVMYFVLVIDQGECMGRVSMHVTVAPRGAAVGVESGDLMDGFRHQRQKVPKHISVFQIGARVPFLCVDQVWEFGWIADEKGWRMNTYHVPIAFFGVEFDSKPAHITEGIRAAHLPSNLRETGEYRGLFADLVQKLGLAKVSDIMRHLCYAYKKHPSARTGKHRKLTKVSMGASPFSVDNSLGDPFTIKVR